MGMTAEEGFFALLFRLGLESNAHSPNEQFPAAWILSATSMVLSFALGAAEALWLPDSGLVPAIVVRPRVARYMNAAR